MEKKEYTRKQPINPKRQNQRIMDEKRFYFNNTSEKKLNTVCQKITELCTNNADNDYFGFLKVNIQMTDKWLSEARMEKNRKFMVQDLISMLIDALAKE